MNDGRVRPRGRCLPGDPHPDCWACTWTGGAGTNPASRSRQLYAMTAYENLLETAERLGTFSISSIWRENGKGYSEINYARHVVHDLWFHRLTTPVQVDSDGKVRLWRLTPVASSSILVAPERVSHPAELGGTR